MLKDIYKRLNLFTTLEEEKKKFRKRIEGILKEIHSNLGYETQDFLCKIAFELGEDQKSSLQSYLLPYSFKRTLFVSEAFLDVLREKNHRVEAEYFRRKIEKAIHLSVIDLGIHFKEGKFFLKGAKELDEKLILENLEWLRNYPDSKVKFENALEYYFRKEYPDAITNAYSALEGITKVFLARDIRLDKKEVKIELLKKLNLDSHWSGIVNNYCKIAHEFSSRHGKKEQKEQILEVELVEFYIYITGVFIRLISQKIK